MKNRATILYPIRTFNKHIVNKVLGKLAGKSSTSFAMVRHVGRKSGKAYETPILVRQAKDAFVIALTYGPGTDWYRNVVAAGTCLITWQKHTYTIEKIEPVDREVALPAFSVWQQPILRLTGIQDFVLMTYGDVKKV